MGLFVDWQRSGYIMKLLIIQSAVCLGWLCNFGLAQLELSDAIVGAASIPDALITCLGNLAIFYTCLLRGRLDVEIGARDVLGTLTGPKLRPIQDDNEDFGLTATCASKIQLSDVDVVMLSNQAPNSSKKQFMKYIKNAYNLDCILLKFNRLKCAVVPVEICYCDCNCIIFDTVDEIIIRLAERIPGTLKRLSHSECLLPCLPCLTNGCHGCNQGLLHVGQIDEEAGNPKNQEELVGDGCHGCNQGLLHVVQIDEEAGNPKNQEELVGDGCHGCNQGLLHVVQIDEEAGNPAKNQEELVGDGCHGCNQGLLYVVQIDEEAGNPKNQEELVGDIAYKKLIEGTPKLDPVAAPCEIIDRVPQSIYDECSCLCIPTRNANDDEWTKMLVRCLKSKDKESRGVISLASDALQNFIANTNSAVCNEEENYSTVMLIVPRVAEVFLNILLTGWFRVDGFSSALLARRAIRDHIVDSRGSGFAANAFLSKSRVFSNSNYSDVCQVLIFRGGFLNFKTLSIIIGAVNLICSISWVVLISVEGKFTKWYGTQSMPLSEPRVVVILVAISISLGMDCLQMYFKRTIYNHVDPDGKTTASGKNIIYGSQRSRLLWMMIILELVCIISGSVIARILGIKVFEKWIYGALHGLVWLKWAIGSYILREYSLEYDRQQTLRGTDFGDSTGLAYASSFFLNAVFAAVRGKW